MGQGGSGHSGAIAQSQAFHRNPSAIDACRRFKETLMKKTILSILTAATVAVALVGSASDASAQRGWVAPAIVGGFVAGAIVGGAVANSYGPAYVVQPGYSAYPGYAMGAPVACPG